MASIRSTRIAYVNNANSATVTLPTGATAGDSCFLPAGHGWNVIAPTAWDTLDNSAGSFVNGGVFSKILTAADITAGSVTVTFLNAYYGIVALICTVGSADVRTIIAARNSSGSTSRTLTTNASPQIGDLAVWFTMGRANITITCGAGAQLQTSSNLEASGVLNSQTLAAAGAASATFTYSSAPSGDYEVGLILTDFPPGLMSTKVEAEAWAEPDGHAASKVEAAIWGETDGLGASKVEASIWGETNGLGASKVEAAIWAETNGFGSSKVEALAWAETGGGGGGGGANDGFCSIIW